MTLATKAPFRAETEDGWLVGPWRAPVNISADAAGTIHDDATARELGLRRGTVAGSIHMEQMVPLALHAFGPDWARRGALSVYFTHATGDGEPVRCRLGEIVRDGENTHARIEMRTPDDVLVCEGVASLGPPPEAGPLRDRLRRATTQEPKDLRMLADIAVGKSVRDAPARMTAARVDQHAPGVTEPLSMFAETPRALSMNFVIDVLRAGEAALLQSRGPFVGLYGAIEVEFIAGPVREETDYTLAGRVLALAESPQTEMAWYESRIAGSDGTPVARMIMMTRLMKASSPHWAP
jgi:hypothetical protein